MKENKFKDKLVLADKSIHWRGNDQRSAELEVARQVSLSGKPRPIGMISLRAFFNNIFDTDIIYESVISTKNEIRASEFIKSLEEDGWSYIYRNVCRILEEPNNKISDITIVKENACMINFNIQYRSSKEGIDKKKSDHDYLSYPVVDEGDIEYIESMSLFTGPDTDAAAIMDSISKLANQFIRLKHEGAEIGIVSIQDNEYYVKSFSLESKTPKFTFPDLHYGDGFEDFHGKLLKRIETSTKGLILLHGEPGTGKTQYIRVLLKELSKINKSILYAPPSLSASLTDPSMIEFISDWILGEERDCILLIEDAEPLLEVRGGSDGRSMGISNLLNMTDGLLNDILGLTVIATFNTPLSKIDPALLRPQRLVARKEFRKLSKDQFEKLSSALGMELPNIKYPASLAEFYAAKDATEVLVHDVIPESRIGFHR